MATPVPSNPAFRKTQAGAQLGKILFTKNSSANISPAQITNLLKLAGVNVPPAVSITADSAQIIMAGGMIASNVETAASIGSYGAPVSAAIQAAIDLLAACGLVDASSSAVQIGRYAAEAATAFSALGTNVYADVALVLDTFQQVSKSTRGKTQGAEEFFTLGIGLSAVDEFLNGKNRLKDLTPELLAAADSIAKSQVVKDLNQRQLAQVTDVSKSLLQFQAKKISVFEFMGTVALQDPEVFYNYFPQMKVFLPPHFLRLSVSTTVTTDQSGGIFNLAKRHYSVTGGYTQDFETSYGYTKDEVIDAIASYFLDPTNSGIVGLYGLMPHLSEAYYGNPDPNVNLYPETKISMGDLAVLSMFPPYFEKIDSTMNLTMTLQNLGLTPYDMGYSFVEDLKTNFHIFPELKTAVNQTPAITFNGVDYFSNTDRAIQASLKTKQALVDQLVAWDTAGDISHLAANPTGKVMLKKWGDSWGNMVRQLQNEVIAMKKYDKAGLPGSSEWLYRVNTLVDPARNIKNFMAICSIGEVLKSDAYLNSSILSSQYIKDKMFAITGLSQSLDDRARQLQFLAIARMLNSFALTNIASFFGTTSDKIKLPPVQSGKMTFVA